MKTVQLTSVSVSTKVEEQAGTMQLSKYVVYTRCAQKSAQTVSKCWDDEDQMPRTANLLKTTNDFGWHSCLPKCHLTKYGLDSIYTILTIEICYNR